MRKEEGGPYPDSLIWYTAVSLEKFGRPGIVAGYVGIRSFCTPWSNSLPITIMGILHMTGILKAVYRAKSASKLDTTKVTRVEVVGAGRELVKYGITGVEVHIQDDGRTLKLFFQE